MPNRRFASHLASALADLGIEHACLSPGSRNTPLLAGLAGEDRIHKWPILDERSAGFFALGLAKATGKPVVLACTSGTAAAEYHPAVVEASQSDTPLLVLTADRPPELRNVGAPQTIDQVSLFGTAVRLFADALPPDEMGDDQAAAEMAIDIWAHATAEPPGPVHLNLPFREPLLAPAPRLDGSPQIPTIELPPTAEIPAIDLFDVGDRLTGRRGLIIAGREGDPSFPAACAQLAAATGFPVIADPLSGLRFGTHDLSHTLGYGDQLVAAGALDQLRPEVILRFGPVPTSKPVWSWLAGNTDVDQILIDRQSRDATRSAATVIEMPPAVAAGAIAEESLTRAPDSWLAGWTDLDAAAADLLAEELQAAAFPNEPNIARVVAEMAPAGTILTVGSSMPIRDLDGYAGKHATSLRVFGNRGANGIDGVVSAGLGTAAAGHNAVVLVGDVSMFHDANALGTAAQLELPVTVVVVNNDGGGIFHFLDHSDSTVLDAAVFDKYLATPHATDFVAVAEAFGIEGHQINDVAGLQGLVAEPPSRPRLVQITTDRRANRDLHRHLSIRLAELIRLQPAG